jgi:tetratricopeptide (TPR) repeat protein
MHDVVSAIARAEAALAVEGGSAERLCELGALKLAGGDADGANISYSQCLTFAPQNALIYNNLGAALLKAGHLPDAVAALESALAVQPGNLRAIVNLGKALREAGRTAEALADLGHGDRTSCGGTRCSNMAVPDARARLALDAAGCEHALLHLDAPFPAVLARQLGERLS